MISSSPKRHIVALFALLLSCYEATATGQIIFKCKSSTGATTYAGTSCASSSLTPVKTIAPKTTAPKTTTSTTTTSTTKTASATTASPTPTAAPSSSASSAASSTVTPKATEAATPTTNNFGTYLKPFGARSPWNSRPINFSLGAATIPTDAYDPVISSGAYSTSFYQATAADGPITIYGVNDADHLSVRDITIPHWPKGVVPASGSDGHIDVLDTTTGIIHSLWMAKVSGDRWTAALYAWSKIDGSGFGDPAHYYQGARAAAVPTSAGLIRKHEIDDGKDQYEHALAMSLTFSGLSPAAGGFIYPATAADGSFSLNKGSIPEGALVMLPPTFDLSQIKNPAIRKVAKTLMTYGAYVVDRNTGTPFAIYQEIGTKSIAGWLEASDTRLIRTALRQATVQQFVDGNGEKYTPNFKQNILSLRGNYYLQSGKVKSSYDSYGQKRVWGKTETKSTELLYIPWPIVAWAKPTPGDTYVVTAKTDGGARFRFQVGSFDSGFLDNGASKTFQWPQSGSMIVTITSGIGESSSVSGSVIKQ